MSAVTALPDAYVTAHLLRQQLNSASLDDLITWSQQPALLTNVTFGKHRGLKWTDVRDGYLNWIIASGGFDENVSYTAKTVRAGRLPPQSLGTGSIKFSHNTI